MIFAGHEFILHPSGVLYWPEETLAIVADLHLEKGSHFAARGFFLPPYDSQETLGRLHDALDALGATRLLVLGDTFHDDQGYHRLSARDRALFQRLEGFAPIWVRGNHDRDFVPPGFSGCDTHECRGVTFRHEAEAGALREISGHYHPKAEVRHMGVRVSRRCFIEDGTRMILPAFGAYAGGLLVEDPAISTLFPHGYRLHLLGRDRVFSLGGDGDRLRAGLK